MNKYLIWIWILILMVSISLCFYLYRLAKQHYLELHQSRINPIGDSDPIWNNLSQDGNLIFLGDSRVKSWYLENLDSNYKVKNLGINGFTSAQLNLRLSVDSNTFKNAIVLIQIGINDLKTIPLFPDKKEIIISQTIENIQKSINICIRKGASKVIITTIFPLGNLTFARRPVWSQEFNLAIEIVNDQIKKWNQLPNIEVFDSYSILEDPIKRNAWGNTKYYNDLLHLNTDGYYILNKSLMNYLKN